MFRKAKIALLLYAAVLLTTACSKASFIFRAPASLENPLTNEPGNRTLLQSKAYNILQQQCMTCHQHTAWNNFKNDGDWQKAGLVIAKDFDHSVLNAWLRHGNGVQSMPQPKDGVSWNNFSVENYQAISDWVADMKTAGSSSSSSDHSPDDPPPIIGETVLPSDNAPRIGDRTFMRSALSSVFGTSTSTNNIINSFIYRKISIFSGTCDQSTFTAVGYYNCEGDMIDVDASPIALPSVGREGQRMRACNELVYTPASLDFSIQQITGRSDLSYLSANPIMSETELRSAYAAFNPGRQLPPTAIQPLLNLAEDAQEANRPKDPWLYVLLALCYAPEWQMP